MENDDLVVKVDEYGCEYLLVRACNLRNFSSLVDSTRKAGLQTGRGLLKLKLHQDDRLNETSLRDILSHLSKTFAATTTTYTQLGKKRKKVTSFNYNPGAQVTFKAAVKDHMYELRSLNCTEEERSQFVAKACDSSSYSSSQSNCCLDHLNTGGLHSVRMHCFEELGKSSPCTSALQMKVDRLQSYGRCAESVCQPSALEAPPRIYGAGIQLAPEVDIEICQGFSLSGLKSVLDLLEEDFDGIVYPYYYAGSKHTVFPWHVEDGGTYSINYHFAGAPKLWFGFSPDKFGAVDHIAHGLNIDIGHVSCRSLLGDHKILVGDPEYFANNHGLCYDMVLQEPGDLILTFPFALHAGVNLGDNLAAAVNYADLPWIELGMYAPYCSCNPTQVQMDLSPILQKHRPDLLHDYLLRTSCSFPLGHPREVRNFSAPVQPMLPSNVRRYDNGLQEEHQANDTESQEDISRFAKSKKPCQKKEPARTKKTGVKFRTLHCPQCPASYEMNKMSRLKAHIKKRHCKEATKLFSLVDLQYPPWKPKSNEGRVCNICSTLIRGTATHLKRHKELAHTDMEEYGQ